MMHHRFQLLLLMVFAGMSLYGQADFRSGYYISLNNDTIRGEIDYRGEIRNSRFCIYRANDQSDPKKFLPSEILAYRFLGNKYYVSKTVEIGGVEQQVFVEYLVNGIANLFYYRNENSNLYLLEKDGGKMLALTNDEKEVLINGTVKIQSSNRYIRLLKASFSDCMELQPSIDRAILNHKSLISITSDYHEYACDGEKCIVYTKEVSKIKLRLGPVVGFSSNYFQMMGGEPFASLLFLRSNTLTLGVLLDLTSYRMSESLSIQLGAEISNAYFYSSFEDQLWPDRPVFYYEAELDAKSLMIFAGPKYTISTGRIKPTFGGGLMLHKFIQTDFWYVKEEIRLEESVFISEFIGNPVPNWAYGLYMQAGLDIELTKRMLLFINLKCGYAFSNPIVIPEIVGQIRVKSNVMPFSINTGLLF